jgi:hypothetical protein
MSDSSFSINIGIQYWANLPVDVKILRKERASCSCVIVSSVSAFVIFYQSIEILFYRINHSLFQDSLSRVVTKYPHRFIFHWKITSHNFK